ncbi:MAG: gliding motility-associated C-terminal domain-containing protein [Bacteroidales bacterium]|nr:gliding motility-associated C-terminal domain-containing protein [Bacteroidales bacterium]
MKYLMNKFRCVLLSALILCGLIYFTQDILGQTVLNNNLIRSGNGSENSINSNGNMQQPFYYNSTLALWRKLTYSSYPLDNTFAIDGDGTNEWNLNGSLSNNPTMTGQVIDLSGYITTTSPNGYGTIISTGTITINSLTLEIKNTYELGQDKSFIKITTNVKNTSGSTINNVRYWVGTRDDYVGGTDAPKKEKGNLVDGAFVKLTNAADRALALRISTADEGVLFYTNSSKGNNIINSCCYWTNVTNQNPQTSSIELTNDGSYGFYVRMNDLASGESDEFCWYYAAGKLADLETIIADVAAASGAVSDITYTTATFKAKTTTAGTGYWMVVPRNSTAPTASEIKNGVNYGSVVVISSGSGLMSANVEKQFSLTNLTAGTSYDLYFVSEDATPEFSSIAKVQFTTNAYTVPVLSTGTVTNISTNTATSGGSVSDDGGQSVIARGVCWSTSSNPTVSGSHSADGSGTGSFTSSLTDLSEGTTYYVRAYATNSVGTGYGNELSFTTISTTISGSNGGTTVAPNALVYIASNATVTGSALEGAYVSINGNYVSGQDILGIDGSASGTIGTISYSFSPSTGILSITGSADVATYQAIIRKVTYSNTEAIPNASSRNIKISLNTALPFSGNGHYYEYVTNPGITWPEAKTIAANRKYFGLQGYLVTITSEEESAFCLSKLLGQGWLGASDEASEGTWKWIEGPENGSVLSYTNWNTGEPNNSGGNEDYAQFLTNGKWNDLSSSNILDGYVVEYGGMAGDPVPDVSDDVTVTFSVPSTTAATDISGTSFRANWNTVSGATKYFLDVATDNSFANIVSGYNNKDVDNVTAFIVSGLDPVTQYFYRFRALLPEGVSFYSSSTAVTTTKLDQTITFDILGDKTYGDDAFYLTASSTSGLPVTYSSSNPSAATVSGNMVTIVGAGTSFITASQAGNDTYFAASDVQNEFTVNKAPLTITAENKSKTYDGVVYTPFTVTYSGFVNSETESVLDGALAYSGTAASAVNAGTGYVITPEGLTSDNYSITFNNGTLDISKAPLTITAENKSKTYDGVVYTSFTVTYSGFVNSETESVLGGALAYSGTAASAVNAGTGYVITVSGVTSVNYDISFIDGSLDISKKVLTVTADSKTKEYGAPDPELTFTYSGWENNENESVLTTLPKAGTTVTLTSPANIYVNAITVSEGADENYSFNYIPADMTVTKTALTVKADDKTKVYGSENPDLTISYNGFRNSEDASVLDEAVVASTGVVLSSNVGNYPVVLNGGSDNNYDLIIVNGNFEVKKALLTITADDKSKTYGNDNPVLTVSYSGFVLGQDQGALNIQPVAQTDALKGSNAGTYYIMVSGAEDENYDFKYIEGDLIINKADQFIRFESLPDNLRATQDYMLVATASSGLTVSFEASDPSICIINNDVLSIKREGDFTITASQNGDQNWNPATEVTLTAESKPTFDNIMSLFTPNSDGMNDYWYIPDIEEYGNISVTIYNRFGKKVYESRSYKNDWDGTWKGNLLPSASYYYIIKSEKRGTINGVVNIVR